MLHVLRQGGQTPPHHLGSAGSGSGTANPPELAVPTEKKGPGVIFLENKTRASEIMGTIFLKFLP